LRENEDFLKENVADDMREQLRCQIQMENQERATELKVVEKLQAEEEARIAEEKKLNSGFNRLKNLKNKILS